MRGRALAEAGTSDRTEGAMPSTVLREWSLDRAVAVGYGVVYDYIFDRFAPYQALRREVLDLVVRAMPPATDRRRARILDIGCGPGNFSLMLAEAGFSVTGIDPYSALIDLAREKRRAKHLPNMAFQHSDIIEGDPHWRGAFDQVLNVHSLYAHRNPVQVLQRAWLALKPGGHGVFVNFTRRVPLLSTFRDIRNREGLGAAFRCLRWVLPNALFEATRRRTGPPHYWGPDEFAERLRAAGFTVLEMRRTFFDDVSLLAWVRKEPESERR